MMSSRIVLNLDEAGHGPHHRVAYIVDDERVAVFPAAVALDRASPIPEKRAFEFGARARFGGDAERVLNSEEESGLPKRRTPLEPGTMLSDLGFDD
jgi:hypothetical protein